MLKPDYYYDSVFEIPYGELHAKGIRGLIFDIDNTLTRFDEDLPPPKIAALLTRLNKMGFKVCLLTNNTNGRLNRFNRNIQLMGIANALKPFTWGIRKAMRLMSVDKNQTVIIGDQLLADVWGGKKAGIGTILVKPITEKDFWFVKIKRIIERRMLQKYFLEIENAKK